MFHVKQYPVFWYTSLIDLKNLKQRIDHMSRHFESESKEPLTVEVFARRAGIDRTTCDSLERYADILKKWQKRFNLVGTSTMNDLWSRHFLDSAQLVPLISDDQGVIVDMGSGAGFPGLVLSIMGINNVQLVESDANKTEFLRQAIRETSASAILHRTRIELYDGPKATIVTSRACAPLNRLLDYAVGICAANARLLFFKGRNWQAELTESQTAWHIDYQSHVSCIDPDGIILEINEFKRR